MTDALFRIEDRAKEKNDGGIKIPGENIEPLRPLIRTLFQCGANIVRVSPLFPSTLWSSSIQNEIIKHEYENFLETIRLDRVL